MNLPNRHLIPDDFNFYFYEGDQVVTSVPRSLIHESSNPSVSWRYNRLYDEWIVKKCPWNLIVNLVNEIQLSSNL